MRAFITGITGQDGSYLAEWLIDHNYEVFGLASPADGGCLAMTPAARQVKLFEANVTDYDAVRDAIRLTAPHECYHLAAQTVVSGPDEFATMQTNVAGTHCVLAALSREAPDCRVFYAGSSEMFGAVDHAPQTEDTPMRPRSLYGVSKVAGYTLMRYYRQEQRMYACAGILYNHESPRRSPVFVTRKVTRAAAAIRRGMQQELRIGNLDSVRDWGDARDYVVAMWKMLQRPEPDDYVIATGVPRTVRDLVEIAFASVGLNWEDYVVSEPQFYRPAESVPLVGCAEKAFLTFGWTPTHDFATTVREMVENDMENSVPAC